MPTVPRSGLNQVNRQALPNTQVRALATAETFGGGQNADRIQQAATQTLGAFREAKFEADKTRVQEAAAETLTKQNNLKYGVRDEQGNLLSPGLFERKGKDAFDTVNLASENYDKMVDETINGFSNDEQKDMYRAYSARQKAAFLEDAQRHQASEIKQYETQVFQSGIEANLKNAVYNVQDPEQVKNSINDQANLIADYGGKNGWSKDETNNKILEVTSRTRAAVITQMVDNKNYPAAKAYFDKERPTMDPLIAQQLDKTMKASMVDYEGGNKAAEIFSRNSGSMANMMNEVQKIQDEDVRKETRSRITEMAQIRKLQIDERNAANLSNALGYAEQGQDAPISVISSLPYEDQRKYRQRLKEVRTGDDVATDWSYYGELQQLRANDPIKFQKTQFDNSKLGATERKEMEKAKAGTGSTESTYASGNEMAIIKQTWAENGLDPKNDKEGFGKFMRRYNERIAAQGTKGGAIDTQKIVDSLMTEVETPGVFFGTNTKRRFDVDYKEIPEEDKAQAIQTLRSRGYPVTEQNVLHLYMQGVK